MNILVGPNPHPSLYNECGVWSSGGGLGMLYTWERPTLLPTTKRALAVSIQWFEGAARETSMGEQLS